MQGVSDDICTKHYRVSNIRLCRLIIASGAGRVFHRSPRYPLPKTSLPFLVCCERRGVAGRKKISRERDKGELARSRNPFLSNPTSLVVSRFWSSPAFHKICGDSKPSRRSRTRQRFCRNGARAAFVGNVGVHGEHRGSEEEAEGRLGLWIRGPVLASGASTEHPPPPAFQVRPPLPRRLQGLAPDRLRPRVRGRPQPPPAGDAPRLLPPQRRR